MATTYSVDLLFKSKGQKELDKFARGAGKVDTAVKKAQSSSDKLGKALGGVGAKAGQAANGINKTGRAAQGAKGQVDGLTRSVRGLVTGAALLAGARFVFGKTAELERTTKQLATVTGSLQTAKGILNELQVINKKSPFSFIELADTAKRLSAFGIANEDLVGTTERLGKAAAATGARVNELSLAYGQVAAKGKLQTEELYQFQERGIPLLDELAKGYGKTKGEVQKLITEGRVGFPAVEQAIKNLTTADGKFAKSFENTSDTLDAKLSNAIDSLGRAAAAFGELLKPTVIEALKSAETLLTDITGVLKSIPQPAANVALKFAEFAAKAFLVSKALKAIIALKLGITGVLASTATNATLAGNASAIAAGKANLLAVALGRLAAIGIVTVGVNYVVNGIASGGRQEGLLQGLESGKYDNTLQNLPYDQAQAALRQEEKTLTGLLGKREKLQQKLKDSAGGFLSLIPGIGPARIGAVKGELNEIEAQIQKSQRILSSKTQAPPKETTQDNPFDLEEPKLDGGGSSGGGRSGGGGSDAGRELAALAESQAESYKDIKQSLERTILLESEWTREGIRNSDLQRARLQNLFDFEDTVERIRSEVNAAQQEELLGFAELKREQADYNALKQSANDFSGFFAEAAQIDAGLNTELTQTQELLKGSFDIITNGLQSGIKGLINGTKELNDVLSDVLSSLGDLFLNAAFSSLGGALKIPGFANGGRPTPGKMAIVGEEGPELWVPDSAGTVIPNDAFDEARGAMGGAATPSEAFADNTSSIATTNSYMREREYESNNQTTVGSGGSMVIETQVINNVEYATVEQVAVASAASAKQARAQVFSDMKNKPSRRAMVGLK